MMRSRIVLALAASAVVFSLGCGTKVADCNKVIAVHNAASDSAKRIDTSKPEGMTAFAAECEKHAAALAMLVMRVIKDEGVKSRTNAMAEAERGLAVEFDKAAGQLKAMQELLAKPMPPDSDGLDKRADEMKAMRERVGDTTSFDAATAKDKAATSAFEAYCDTSGAK